MFFLNSQKDQPLYQELIREGVMNAALWESLELPAEGYLLDVLIANREKIDPHHWVDWLIRKHNCTRIPGLFPSYKDIKALPRDLLNLCITSDCYPLIEQGNHIFVGINRGDYPEAIEKIQENSGKKVLYRNALTMDETFEIRKLCQKAINSL